MAGRLIQWCELCAQERPTDALAAPLGTLNTQTPVYACAVCYQRLIEILSSPERLRALLGLWHIGLWKDPTP